jgi:hypothetical protein
MPQSQKRAPVLQIFWPFRTQSLPSRTALERRPAGPSPRRLLLSWHQTTWSRAISLM